jgi:hypothetical protein
MGAGRSNASSSDLAGGSQETSIIRICRLLYDKVAVQRGWIGHVAQNRQEEIALDLPAC